MKKPHTFAQSKRQLKENVIACSLRASHLPDSVKAFSDAAWQCLQARKIQLPVKTKFVYASWFMGTRIEPKRSTYTPAKDDKALQLATKALTQFDRDAAFCWDTLSAAIDDAVAGSKQFTRLVNARRKWREEYDERYNWIESNCKKESRPVGIESTKKAAKMRAFYEAHGALHMVATSDRMFATAEDAEAYALTTKDAADFAEKTVGFNTIENQRLCRLLDEGRWDELSAGLDRAEQRDAEQESDELQAD